MNVAFPSNKNYVDRGTVHDFFPFFIDLVLCRKQIDSKHHLPIRLMGYSAPVETFLWHFFSGMTLYLQ